MKTLYKHAHIIVDDKREYIDGSILINDKTIEDVFVSSIHSIEEVKEIDLKGKIIIPSFFDSKSNNNKQKGIARRFICSDKVLNEPTHLYSDEEIKELKNVAALTRINNYKKVSGIKTLINPANDKNIFADGVSDITNDLVIDFNSNKMINYVFNHDCYVEFGIDKHIQDEYIKFVLKNININNIMLISFNHDNIIDQVKRLYKLNVSLTDIVAMTSINAYNFYGNTKFDGYLIKGKQANFICLNDNMDIEFVLKEGEIDA